MSRLPFDPAKMAAARATAAPPASPAVPPAHPPAHPPAPPAGQLSVSQLAALIERAVRDKIERPLRVVGEVSNFTDRTHWYFTIKDAGAAVSCVMFAAPARRAGFTPAPGQEVVVTGFVDFYAPQGKLTFRVEKIEPVGAGALELAFRKLCDELKALGSFADDRKRPLPLLPRRIAVVTSRTGAALQDVIDTARRRAPFVEICPVDTLVQGAAAASAVAAAINWVSANAAALGIDTLIVTRGGGSMEDLWAFNERIVADAILRCTIPVAAAIGHETDVTIAELVADLRCSTPTQAAMRATPDATALLEQVDTSRRRLFAGLTSITRRAAEQATFSARHLAAAARERISRSARRLEQLAARIESHKPAAVLERRSARLARAAERLSGAMKAHIVLADTRIHDSARGLREACTTLTRSEKERIDAASRQLELVGPASVLARGFSVTFGPTGAVLRRAQDVKPGQSLTTNLAEGTVDSTVNGLADLGVRHGERRRKPKREEKGQPGLFGDPPAS